MKITKYLFLVLLGFQAQSAMAANLYSPALCPGQAQLKAKNLSTKEEGFMALFRDDTGALREWPLAVTPLQEKTFQPDELPPFPFWLKPSTNKLWAFQVCNEGVTPWVSRVSPFRQWNLKPHKVYKLFVQNLNPEQQTLMLRFLTAERKTLKVESMPLGSYLHTTSFKFTATDTELEIYSEGRVSVQLVEVSGSQWTAIPEKAFPAVKVAVDPLATYFLMTSTDGSDSFVFKTQDPVMIAKARDLIRQGYRQLMVADISYRPQSENRNLLSSDRTPYSWTVEKVINFNDFASVSCNGYPEGVEDKIFERLSSKRICFWDYQIDRELNSYEVQYGILDK